MQKIAGPFAEKSKGYKPKKSGFKDAVKVATSERAADAATVGKEYKKKDKSPGTKKDPRW